MHHHGRAVLLAAIGWGLAIAGVGLSDSVAIVLLMLGLAGAADMISGLFRMLIWNQTIPDELRGRMAGVEMLSYSIGPTLGQVRSTGRGRADLTSHEPGVRWPAVRRRRGHAGGRAAEPLALR